MDIIVFVKSVSTLGRFHFSSFEYVHWSLTLKVNWELMAQRNKNYNQTNVRIARNGLHLGKVLDDLKKNVKY